MTKPAKTTLAIAMSFLLIVAQTVFATVACETLSKSQACTCCSCQETNCCVSESESASVPVQPLSLPAASGNHSFAAVLVSFLSLPASENVRNFVLPSRFTSPRWTAVPVYARNCAYLI